MLQNKLVKNDKKLSKKNKTCETWEKDKMGTILDNPKEIWSWKENSFK